TFKLLTAATALEQGITPERAYCCNGNIKVGENIFNCHKLSGHGEINMHTALKKSCNTYFISLGIKVGGQNLLFKAKRLGFGSPFFLAPDIATGSGNLPTEEDLLSDAATANFAFGQGALTATPVQIACLISAMANGGNAVTPRLIEGTTTDGAAFSSHTARYSPQNIFLPSAAENVRRMMIEVVESGSGVKAKPEKFGAGGKTASAQSGQFVQGAEVVHAWFSGFYPAENPQYSIVVLYEGGDSGGDMACPVFKEICDGIGDYNIPTAVENKISSVDAKN
ncbi:MAG: penicillin-binding transpeptidase domain-containing protein, partial [Oscillospiraceae bacterium]